MYFSGGHFFFWASIGIVWHTEGTPHARQPPPKIHPQKRQNPPQERLQKICRESSPKNESHEPEKRKTRSIFSGKAATRSSPKKSIFSQTGNGEPGKSPSAESNKHPTPSPQKHQNKQLQNRTQSIPKASPSTLPKEPKTEKHHPLFSHPQFPGQDHSPRTKTGESSYVWMWWLMVPYLYD